MHTLANNLYLMTPASTHYCASVDRLTRCVSLHSLDVLLVHGRHGALGRGCHDGRRVAVVLLLSNAHDAGDQEGSGGANYRGIQGGRRAVA